MIASGIAAYRAAPTGPARVREHLTRSVRGLRSAARAIAVNSGVGFQFPSEVTGDSLMAVFGSRLRDLLVVNGQSAAPSVTPRRTAAAEMTSEPQRGSRGSVAMPRTLLPRSTSEPASVRTLARPSNHASLAGPSVRPPGSAADGSVALPPGPMTADVLVAPSRSRVAGELAMSREQGRTAQTVTLASSLNRYFVSLQSTGAAASESSTSRIESPPSNAPAVMPQAVPANVGGPAWHSPWLNGQSRQPAATSVDAPSRERRGVFPEVGRAFGGRYGFSLPLPLVGTDSEPSDFADLLADVLREQAIRNGVDLS